MQFALYLVVGGLSFLADLGVFVGLRAAQLPIIPASVTSFVLATGCNYLLCVLLAFDGGRFSRHLEIMRFLTVVLISLALNTFLVWWFVYLSMNPVTAKIIAVPIMVVWNYLGRRLLVFSERIPLSPSLARCVGYSRETACRIEIPR